MSCPEHDVKGYLLGELPEQMRQTVEEHLKTCGSCQEEYERLQLTNAALLAVPDEEIPQRIAFVSDKLFEPSWWQRLWRSGPRLGFASAAMLSLAICVHAFTRPAPVVQPTGIDAAEVARIVEQQVTERLDQTVRAAVATVEQRQEEKTAAMLKAAEREFELRHREDMLTVQENFEVLLKRFNVMYVASTYQGGDQ